MSRVDVIMPQMGESIAEGTVSKWLKQVGDTVKRDEAILEISTDKVDAEIPSPSAGVLVEIKVPKASGGFNYQKFNKRASDWAIVGAAAVKVNGGFHVALTNMGSTPIRASAVEQALSGGASVTDAAQAAAEGTSPSSDINATPEYRQHLARVLTRRALEAAAG